MYRLRVTLKCFGGRIPLFGSLGDGEAYRENGNHVGRNHVGRFTRTGCTVYVGACARVAPPRKCH